MKKHFYLESLSFLLELLKIPPISSSSWNYISGYICTTLNEKQYIQLYGININIRLQ